MPSVSSKRPNDSSCFLLSLWKLRLLPEYVFLYFGLELFDSSNLFCLGLWLFEPSNLLYLGLSPLDSSNLLNLRGCP